MNNLKKNNGQVFTPNYLVRLILDEAGYFGENILYKHCIDNSCGDGAFLSEIVKRYAYEYKKKNNTIKGLRSSIETYIHGIEIEESAYNSCLKNLARISSEIGVCDCNFDIVLGDALKTQLYNNKMSYVVGNPPYVRVHNLNDEYNAVKSFSFAASGMTDLYLVFFELGYQMLCDGGKLCYITPSSWLNSVAGSVLRNFIRKSRSLKSLIDLEHYQAFNATTYTIISLFEKGIKHSQIDYYNFDPIKLNKVYIDKILISEMDINGQFYLARKDTLDMLRTIMTCRLKNYATVKNGFATLSDKIFLSNNLPFTQFTIPVIKASTGRWIRGFFPYDKSGKPISKERLFGINEVQQYLMTHKENLLKGAPESKNPSWYLYGRTQALKDVFKNKLAVNVLLRDISTIKANLVPSGSGVYSGIYVISNYDLNHIKEIITNEDFITYITALKKYKSGGYYTFNTKDLESYLNYVLEKENKHKHNEQLEEQRGLFSFNY